ncbi:hypothetical protein DPV78_003595 [Talaromyces pinophilus]|nr:hypothetical protein DPV78_003595 [Talaromyces pinophilus]
MVKEFNSLCSNCSQFANEGFWDPPSGEPDPIESGLKIIRRFCDIKSSNTCPMCRLVCQALQKKSLCPSVPTDDAYIYYSRVVYGKYTTQNSIVKRTYRLRVSTSFQYSAHSEDERFQTRAYGSPYQSDEDCFEGDIMLLKGENDTEALFHGRRMDGTLNIPLVKRWIDTCSKECKAHRIFKSNSSISGPKRVINTKQLLIRYAPSDCIYAALSYTWGSKTISQLRLTKKNELQLMSSGGLRSFWNNISQTIRDAICLCDSLGIEYLWVDALCRGQGNGYEGEGNIEDINHIFAKAYLTIVGNGSNFNYHLSGVCSDPVSPSRHQDIEQVGQMTLAVSKPLIDESMHRSSWMGRVWILNEFIVSQHLLVLADEQAFFCCKAQHSPYSEDTYSEIDSFSPKAVLKFELPKVDDLWSLHASSFDSFTKYAVYVEEYSRRCVTKLEDLSRGFAVVVKHLETELGLQSCYRLPVKFFTRALCFTAYPSECSRLPTFPSWSWLGWKASIYILEGPEEDFGLRIFKPAELLECPTTEDPQSIPVLRSSKFGDLRISSCYSHNNSFRLEMPHGLPKELWTHVLVLEAPVADLYTSKRGEDWVVFSKRDGDFCEIGNAVLNWTRESSGPAYLKYILIDLCQEDIDFYLVLAPSGYGNTFCRLGSSTNLHLGSIVDSMRKEIVYVV